MRLRDKSITFIIKTLDTDLTNHLWDNQGNFYTDNIFDYIELF